MYFKLTFAAIVSFAALTAAERVFQFENSKTSQQMKEVAEAIQATGEIRELTINGNEMLVKGSPAELEFAAWLFPQLDAPLTSPRTHTATADFLFDGDPQDVVRVLHVAHADSDIAFLELHTAIRATTEIRHVHENNRTRSIVTRARPIDVDSAQWIFDQLDQASKDLGSKPRLYTRPIPPDPGRSDLANHLGIFPLTHPTDPYDFKELATALRLTARVPWSYTDMPAQALVVRGDAPQMEMLRWLFEHLDQASSFDKSIEYRSPQQPNDIVYLFHTSLDTSTNADELRQQSRPGMVATYDKLNTLIVRGTEAEILQARQVLEPSRR